MPNVKRVVLEGCCYHLITRGNQKQKVFKCNNDCEKYLYFLKKFKRKYKFNIYAYCLMPNHVHIIGQPNKISDLSKFMHDLNRTYTLYFNNKYKKVGHLWQGRFKSKIISRDNYLIDCLNYVEYNPVRKNLIQNVSEYIWSSYRSRILDKNNGLIDELPLS